jgi:hypothetical protein
MPSSLVEEPGFDFSPGCPVEADALPDAASFAGAGGEAVMIPITANAATIKPSPRPENLICPRVMLVPVEDRVEQPAQIMTISTIPCQSDVGVSETPKRVTSFDRNRFEDQKKNTRSFRSRLEV